MKINNITITNAEALNLSKAINYAIRVHGTIDVEVYTLYASHDRDVNIIVHTQDGWDKTFNLTTGAVTNIVEEDTGDTDGDHGASILDRLENVMDRYRVTIVVDDLGMCEFYLHWAEKFAALARKRGQHPLFNRDVQFNITWAMRYLNDAIDGSIYLGMADHEAFMELYNELWDRRKAIEK